MNFYSIVSKVYDLLDITYFSEKGKNPRNIIQSYVSIEKCRILDLCCGTFSNGFNIAKKNEHCKIMGVDISEKMLGVANRKIKKAGLNNVYLKKADATNTKLPDKSFDYIIIGLVLHECSPELREGILKEAYRVLKDNGKMIILEWEKSESLMRRIKYAPLYAAEIMNCEAFKQFFECNKKDFFEKYNFKTLEEQHCNYSTVMLLEKLQ